MKLFPEWKEHHATLLAWPQREDLWEECLEEVQDLWARVGALLSRVEQVHILVNPGASTLKIKEKCLKHDACLEKLFFHFIPTDDVWIRDYGPLWVREKGAMVFGFDAWGKKYFPYEQDHQAGARFLQKIGHEPPYRNFVLEGGALDTDGHSLLLTESSVLYRQPFYSREQYEEEFRKCFSIKKFLWLRGGLPGDDTDGHVDMITRFFDKNKVLTCLCPESHPAHGILHHNYELLLNFRDAQGQGLEIIDLPLPPQAYLNGRALIRSHANFYVANGLVLVPTYKAETDRLALERIQNCFPKHRVIGVDACLMALGGGGIHCMTLQGPVSFV